MTEYRWSETLERGIDLFGITPTPTQEHELREAFKTTPAKVSTLIEDVGRQKLAGAEIRNGWAIVRKRVENSTAEDIVVEDSSAAERKIVAARRWIHNAGLHLDLEADIISELFDVGGILHEHDSGKLRAEMLEAWRQERPRGVKAEAATADYQTTVGKDARRFQWQRAKLRGEKWADRDDTFEAYEAARKAGRRPHWRGEGAPTFMGWPAVVAQGSAADDERRDDEEDDELPF